jgi:hypothetical protein
MMNDQIENKFELKESLTVEGITEDYVWYNAKNLINEMDSWRHKFERVVKVMENRHSEHLKMIDRLMAENHALKRKAQKDE